SFRLPSLESGLWNLEFHFSLFLRPLGFRHGTRSFPLRAPVSTAPSPPPLPTSEYTAETPPQNPPSDTPSPTPPRSKSSWALSRTDATSATAITPLSPSLWPSPSMAGPQNSSSAPPAPG